MGYDPGRSERLTMGTALNMAATVGSPVSILVGGLWISGRMGKKDSEGVSVYVEASGEPGRHYDEWVVIKHDAMQAVRIPADLESRPAIEAV